MRWLMLLWLTLVACLTLASPGASVAQLRGTIFGPGTKAFPVAVTELQTGGVEKTSATQFADIVTSDLTMSGLMRVIPRDRYIEPVEGSGVTDTTINFADWSVLGALALVKGTLASEGSTFTVEARLFDVSQRRQLVGRRYRGTAVDVRRMAHKFADEIMAQLTQERGPFDSQIAFLSRRGGRFKDLYVVSLDGGDVRRITNNNTLNLAPSWAPNTRTLLFTSYQKRNPDLYSVDIQTKRMTKISSLRGMNVGRWSPDGTQLAVATEQEAGNPDLVILGGDGSMRRRLTDHWAIDVSPSWSPDGTQIAFCSSRSGAPQIYIIGADGTGLRRVTSEGSYNTSPTWSPKGDRIAYSSRLGGRFQIFTVKIDGSGVQQVTNTAGTNEDPSWAPDGRYLVFSSTRDGRSRLYVSDLTGANQVQLTDGNGDDTSPAWSSRLE
jgi:TolB protein